jgi:nicotinamide-nucleotide amidase
MKISTLSIGDELVYGEVMDTNSAHIAAKLYDVGIKVQRHLLVGDNEPDIMESIEALAERSEALIVTGGLGPTADDLTARAAAKVTGRRLILNDEALNHMREFVGKEGGEFHAATERQALLPAKSTIIPNPTGTASGFIITWYGRYLFFLPGVPSEMARMLDDTVLPFVQERLRQKVTIRTKIFTLFGIPEAEIDQIIRDVPDTDNGLSVAFRVRFPTIDVKLRGEGDGEEMVAALLEKAASVVRERLDDYIVAEDGATLDEEVARLFREKGVTVSLAESCTGGLIAKRLTDVAGSSAYFLQGAVVYSNAAKTRMLKVPAKVIDEKGAVSAEVARAMARGARKVAGSNISLAVTGVAGPGATEEKPAGTVYIALADGKGCMVKGYHFRGDRRQVRSLTAFTALDWLRRYLLLR